MRFNHTVKYGGVYYKAGEEVPMEQRTEKPSAPFVSVDKDEIPKTKKRGRPAKKEQ